MRCNDPPILKIGRKVKVAYLGPKGTFSEIAAKHYFSNVSSAEYIEVQTIPDVFRLVEDGKVNYGVVPAENSIEGSVNITLDMLYSSSKAKITGEVIENIQHNLIAKSRIKIKNLKVILSHPHALAQCRRFIAKNFPNVKLLEVESTAQAVKKLKNISNAAAIASEYAAKIYGMKVVARNIGDYTVNYTRFLVLSRKDSKPTGRDKTFLIFSLKDKPGALFNFLKPFANRGINLTKIESRPSKVKPWEYIFFMELEGHRKNKKCIEALREAKDLCENLKILGSYPAFKS
ncbi:MAG: prephenate dehydratase [Candidatus Bathyarchaeota archaeon]